MQPNHPPSFHAFCCGVSCCAFVILVVITVFMFAYGFILPAITGWLLSLVALLLILHHNYESN